MLTFCGGDIIVEKIWQIEEHRWSRECIACTFQVQVPRGQQWGFSSIWGEIWRLLCGHIPRDSNSDGLGWIGSTDEFGLRLEGREGGREGGIGFLGCSQKHTRSLREGWELMRYQQYSLLLSVLSSGVWSLTSLIKLRGPAMNWNSSSGNDKDNWWQWHSQVDTKEELKCEASWFVYRKAIIYMRSWEVETKGVISCYPLWIQ